MGLPFWSTAPSAMMMMLSLDPLTRLWKWTRTQSSASMSVSGAATWTGRVWTIVYRLQSVTHVVFPAILGRGLWDEEPVCPRRQRWHQSQVSRAAVWHVSVTSHSSSRHRTVKRFLTHSGVPWPPEQTYAGGCRRTQLLWWNKLKYTFRTAVGLFTLFSTKQQRAESAKEQVWARGLGSPQQAQTAASDVGIPFNHIQLWKRSKAFNTNAEGK